MKILRPFYLLVVLCAACWHSADAAPVIKLACVGDSITAGDNNYPTFLARILGKNYEVRNFGVSGRTLLKKGDFPYWNENAYRDALAFKPDVVVIMLGTNDSKHPTARQPDSVNNWQYKADYVPDYEALVASFRTANPTAKIYVAQPVPAFPGRYGIDGDTIHNEIGPMVAQVAKETDTNLLDLYTPLLGKGEFFPDTVHPNQMGARLMAAAVYKGLTGQEAPDMDFGVNSFFSDGAVLQRGVELPIFGTARDGTSVKVELAGRTGTTVAKDGKWEVRLPALSAGGPYTLAVTADRTLRFDNILIGDVWVASGQSNMERQLGPHPPQKDIEGWQEAAATANEPQIRQFLVPLKWNYTPQFEVKSNWTVLSPQTAGNFSAVGFFFARALHKDTKVPVGILFSAWGGTVAEAWVSANGLKAVPDFANAGEEVQLMAQGSGGADYAHDLTQWIERNDAGSKPGALWSTAVPDGTWTTENLPAQFPGDLDGVKWYHRELEIQPGDEKRAATLHLGSIDDADTTFVNGAQVGATNSWDGPRDYALPAGTLHAGLNTIAVRVLDTGGGGGFGASPQNFKLELAGTEAINLAGPWSSKVGVDVKNAPALPARPNANQNTATVLYNGMIAPLQKLPIKGVLWYQGESNNGRARQYRDLLPALVADWRQGWQQNTRTDAQFPFLIVQIAPNNGISPELREAQLLTVQKTPKTALVVTTDVGDADDIHPPRKGPIGERLALAARSVAYGEKIESSGPVFESVRWGKGRGTLRFSHLGSGLIAQGGALRGFTVAGKDGKFVPAQAEIRGKTVVVWADGVTEPTAVRYGWANVPDANLFNQAGLPASPFRSDVD